MNEKDPVTVPAPTTANNGHKSLKNDDQAFIDEFTSLSPKVREKEQQEEDEYVTTLLARENGCHQLGRRGSGCNRASIQIARIQSIQWLLQTRARLGLGYRTAYLSIMYFDRFLSLKSRILQGKEWRIRLLMLTCLSLAAKMEEVNLLTLSAYGGDQAEFNFGIKWIKKMEFRVLYALQWEMRFVWPFPLIPFFLRYLVFQPQLHISAGKAVSAAALIIFQAAKVIGTMEYKPSVMAMAATLLVMDSSLSKSELEAKISASGVSSYGFAATPEQVHSCYEMLKKLAVLDDRPLLSSPSSSGSSEVSRKRRSMNVC